MVEFSSDPGRLFPEMYGIMVLRRRAAKDKPLHGAKIACCTHVTAQTAVSHLLISVSCSFSSSLFFDICQVFENIYSA